MLLTILGFLFVVISIIGLLAMIVNAIICFLISDKYDMFKDR